MIVHELPPSNLVQGSSNPSIYSLNDTSDQSLMSSVFFLPLLRFKAHFGSKNYKAHDLVRVFISTLKAMGRVGIWSFGAVELSSMLNLDGSVSLIQAFLSPPPPLSCKSPLVPSVTCLRYM